MNLRHLFYSMIILNLFAYITIVIRPKLFKVKLFKPMVWNLKLSILPLIVLVFISILSIFIIYSSTYFNIIILSYIGYAVFFVGLLAWLALLPNSAYLLTELNLTHREEDEREVPIWYDIISILTFSLSGIINTMFNISIIILYILIYFDPNQINGRNISYVNLLAFGIIILISIGIYLGRMIRFNTWDLLKPKVFLKKLISHFNNAGILKNFLLFVLFHSVFLSILYYMIGISSYFLSISG